MTTSVVEESVFVPLFPQKLLVTEQSSYAVILPGTRVSITEQSSFIVMFASRRLRRVFSITTG